MSNCYEKSITISPKLARLSSGQILTFFLWYTDTQTHTQTDRQTQRQPTYMADFILPCNKQTKLTRRGRTCADGRLRDRAGHRPRRPPPPRPAARGQHRPPSTRAPRSPLRHSRPPANSEPHLLSATLQLLLNTTANLTYYPLPYSCSSIQQQTSLTVRYRTAAPQYNSKPHLLSATLQLLLNTTANLTYCPLPYSCSSI